MFWNTEHKERETDAVSLHSNNTTVRLMPSLLILWWEEVIKRHKCFIIKDRDDSSIVATLIFKRNPGMLWLEFYLKYWSFVIDAILVNS